MKRFLQVSVASFAVAFVAFAVPPGQRAQCKRDAKGFVKVCEDACEQQRKKKPQAADGCRKMCREQVAQIERECDK